ncbi:NmrA family transcriptional regulator [Streptomyces sp. SBT349]|uniref:NmrA family transcriptional regulator n=1 Tax=Streptomyces sp. SBT349 TaxID=1580539 RepID=UPI00066AC41E|nr:NmrA family transcriptional regulator [Streptomyces sp. SBT349]
MSETSLDNIRAAEAATIANGRILVLGATGKTGRRIAGRLPGARLGSRSGTPPFDWENRTTWEPVLEGAEAVFMSYYPDIAAPGAAETIGAFSERAVAQGVRRLVLLSGRGEARAEEAERAMQRAGAAWTVLRAAWFAQNFSEDFLRESVLGGEVVLPAAPGLLEPFVDAEDIADVAVAALTDPRHAGRVYELTGPRLLTFGEALGEIAAATGREVRFRPVSPVRYAEVLAGAGLPPEAVALLTEVFTAVLDGRNARVTADVPTVLGRPARDFSTYVADATAGGAWTTAAAAIRA